jgi:hypothetical protein
MVSIDNYKVEFGVILIKRFTYVNLFYFHARPKNMKEKTNSFSIFREEKEDRKTVNDMVHYEFKSPLLNRIRPTYDYCTRAYDRSGNFNMMWKESCLIGRKESVGCGICTRNCLAEVPDEFDSSILIWKALCVTSLRNCAPSKHNRGFWRFEDGN